VLISGISSLGFDSDYLYKLKVLNRLYSFRKAVATHAAPKTLASHFVLQFCQMGIEGTRRAGAGRRGGGRLRSPESRQGGGKVRGGGRCSGRPPR
jgi:hypothetical protein